MKHLDLNTLFMLFGIDINHWMSSARNFIDARNKFKEAKEEVKKRFKQQAFELHPDRNPGFEEEFKQLSNAKELIEKLEIAQPRPPPMIRVFVDLGGTMSSGFGNYTGTTSTTTINYW